MDFQMWFLGMISGCLLSFRNPFFSYRTETLLITMISVHAVFDVANQPVHGGSLPEVVLSTGLFKMKEHVLISSMHSLNSRSVGAIAGSEVVHTYTAASPNLASQLYTMELAAFSVENSVIVGFVWSHDMDGFVINCFFLMVGRFVAEIGVGLMISPVYTDRAGLDRRTANAEDLDISHGSVLYNNDEVNSWNTDGIAFVIRQPTELPEFCY